MKNIWLLFLIFNIGIAFPVNTISILQNEKEKTQKVQYDENTDLKSITFDKESIEKFKSNKSFDYSEPENADNWWTQFKRWVGRAWINFWQWLFGDFSGNAFLSFIIKVLPYLIIAAVIVFVIWIFYKINPGAFLFRKKENPLIVFSEEEEIIRNSNIEELIQEALINKDYRLAVRYYYLRILKHLSEAEMIDYEADKTNSDYNKEITSNSIKVGFEKATLLYDYIWYGSFEVSETDFQKAQITFHSLERIIPKSNE